MSEAGIKRFFDIARERQNIYLKRRAGLPKPWSSDPIFQTEYFCNVFREQDRTTEWFRNNIRDQLRNESDEVLAAIVAFRWFNKIETGERIRDFLLGEWDSVGVYNALQNQKPVVTGAYIIKTPDGMTKLRGVLWCIDEFNKRLRDGLFDTLICGAVTMQEACKMLQQAPYLGNFMAWQICSDARQTCLLENAPDKDMWAQPGPGSARGLGRVFYNNFEYFDYGSKSHEKEMLNLMQLLASLSKDPMYWPNDWPKMAVIDVSHTLCETDKYLRCQEGGRMKRKYNAA